LASPVIPRHRRSIFARILAVLALAAAVIALISIVNAFRNDTSSGKGDGKGNHSGQNSKNSKNSKKEEEIPKTYVVEQGDNLGTISDKFKVRVPVLEKLNPKIDPQTLNTGETLVLRK
jgi:LysM repeat protein